MYLKSITTRNIQNHRDVTIDLPPTGLVVFTGNNSNGKSVIVKTTRIVISGLLTKPRKRANLVNRKATFGEIIYRRSDDVVLTAHIAREAHSTFVKLEVPGQEPIVRYLADRNYTELTSRFGWHYDADSGLSLNIAEEEEALLFYKTSNKINARLVETATSDSRADKAVDKFEAVLKETRTLRDQWAMQIKTYQTTLSGIQVESIQPLEEAREKLSYLYNILSKIYIPTIPEIQAVPKVSYVEVHVPTIPKVKYPRIVSMNCNIPDILPIAEELRILRDNKCPTCGRGFDCEC